MTDDKPLACECEALRDKLREMEQNESDMLSIVHLKAYEQAREQTARECIDIALGQAQCCGCSDIIADRIRERYQLIDRP